MSDKLLAPDGPGDYTTRSSERVHLTTLIGDHWYGVLLPDLGMSTDNAWNTDGTDFEGYSQWDIIAKCQAATPAEPTAVLRALDTLNSKFLHAWEDEEARQCATIIEEAGYHLMRIMSGPDVWAMYPSSLHLEGKSLDGQ